MKKKILKNFRFRIHCPTLLELIRDSIKIEENMELHTSIKQNKQYLSKTKRDRNGEIKRDRKRKKKNRI